MRDQASISAPEQNASSAPSARLVTVLLADDDPVWLVQVGEFLQSEFQVVGAVRDGEAFLMAAKTLQPDLCLLDISMPGLNGFQAARQLRKQQPNARILFLTTLDEPEAVTEALAIGVSGYVLKHAAPADLIPALRKVLQGEQFFSESSQA